MKMKSSCRYLAVLAGSLLLVPAARADWTVTTYKGIPAPNSMEIADLYFTGVLPTRFEGTGTVTMVDLYQNGGEGQFTINNPFPGVDDIPAVGDTNDFTARITGTLVVDTPGDYNFFTDTDDGNRFRLDLNQDGVFEDAAMDGTPLESIVPYGGLQGAGDPERSGDYTLAAGSYDFEVSFFEAGGGASVEAGYRVAGVDTQYVLGDASGGISLAGPADVRTVGAAPSPAVVDLATADALRTGENFTGFPVTEFHEVFNFVDTGAGGDFPGDVGAPGLGDPDASDDNDFLVVGTGYLVVPFGGISDAVFRSNTDDGGRLLIDVNQDGDLNDPEDAVIVQDALQGPTNTDSAATSLAAGIYLAEYSWFERGGGAEGEVSVSLAGGADGTFYLLGDDAAASAGVGLDIATSPNPIPEPGTFALAALLSLGLAGVTRRKR